MSSPATAASRAKTTSPGASPATAAEEAPLVLLHGLTATRRYVLMGSRLLERHGHRVISYDARGHGQSSPAPAPAAYAYSDQVADLSALLDAFELDRAGIVGASMGAATATAFALSEPDRVSALVLVTPAYAGAPREDHEEIAEWERLAGALASGGTDGFLAVYRPAVEERWRESVLRFTRERLKQHRHPEAVADAMRVVPTSAAFDGLDKLERVTAPTLVVASRDEPDPAHPLALAEDYAERLPQAELVVEEPGEPPIAWRGGRLSREIADFLERFGEGPNRVPGDD